eukprot:6482084-Amphidinium_carterae.2
MRQVARSLPLLPRLQTSLSPMFCLSQWKGIGNIDSMDVDQDFQRCKNIAGKYGCATDDAAARLCLAEAHALKVESQLVSLLTDASMPVETRRRKTDAVMSSMRGYSEEFGHNVKDMVLKRLVLEGINSTLGAQSAKPALA